MTGLCGVLFILFEPSVHRLFGKWRQIFKKSAMMFQLLFYYSVTQLISQGQLANLSLCATDLTQTKYRGGGTLK